MSKINSAHSVLKAIGGVCLGMLNGTMHMRPTPAPKMVKGDYTKLFWSNKKRYSHVLSDYISQKNLDKIQKQGKVKAFRKLINDINDSVAAPAQ